MLSTRPVLLLVLLLTFSQHCATALPTPTECCFHYAQKPVRLANILSFYETPKDCAFPAVVTCPVAEIFIIKTHFHKLLFEFVPVFQPEEQILQAQSMV
ncbi:uncharacterized protein V3H86_007415 [Mergus octosetaceus]